MNRRNFVTKMFQMAMMAPLVGLNIPQVIDNNTTPQAITIPYSERTEIIDKWAKAFEDVTLKANELLIALDEARYASPDELDHKYFFKLTDDFHGLVDDVSHDMEMLEFEELFRAMFGKDSFHCYVEGEIAGSAVEDLGRIEDEIPILTGDPDTQDRFYSLIEARRNGSFSRAKS